MFQDRFHAVAVEDQSHCWELSRYVHLNPVRAGLTDDPFRYRWSPLDEIGRSFGGIAPSAVSEAVRRAQRREEQEFAFRQMLEELRRELR